MPKIFIEGNHKCAEGSSEYQAAEKIAYELSKKGFDIVGSTGKGVSEAAFNGAIKGNNNSKRIAIDCNEFKFEKNSKYSEVIATDNYFEMKKQNCTIPDAFIFFTGSFNVLSNLFIILQLKELELMGEKTVICIGEQLEEGLSACSFYNEDILDSFGQIFFVEKSEDAVTKILENFKV